MHFRLRWKILLLVVLAPLALASGALHLVNREVTEKVRADVDDALHRSTLVCQKVLEARQRTLGASARVIAQDPRFFATLAIPVSSRSAGYRATVRGVARDFNLIAKADLFEVLDAGGRPLASVGRASTDPPARGELLRARRAGNAVPEILVLGGEIFLVTLTPVRAADRLVGQLLLGSRVGDELAAELRDMTRSEVTFLADGEVTASTLTETALRTALRDTVERGFDSRTDLLHAGVFELRAGDDTHLTLVRALPGAAAGGGEYFVLQRSLERELTFLGALQTGLGELGLFTLVAALLVGLLVSHKVTRPLLEIVRGAEQMERGNYEHPIRVGGHDEIGYLARRFREMREHERTYIHSLEEAARLKSEFIDVASHELRTPTTVIQGYAELFAQGALGEVTPKQREALEAIEKNLGAILQIAENATWMAQIEGQRPILEREETPLWPLLEEVTRRAASESASRKVALSSTVEPNDLSAWIDAPRLTQALTHLVRNGIRFTPDGGSVTVRARQEGEELVLEVEDTGIGVPEERRAALFDRSLTVSDARHHHSSSGLEFNSKGLGLGLPIARGVVEAHGGTLSVAAGAEGGSVFALRLPAQPADDAKHAA